jgi:nucleoside-diphosphate-sugar epimerase/glycosyltransferase involved in cell wall biosynthesis/MoaA/NifB/PqqE/SkfB family radical SAM enzyme
MSRVLVTGAAGAIGSSLVPALEAAGFDVVLLDRAIDADHELVGGRAVPELLRGCDGVIHLAACARVGAAERGPDRAHDDNVEATAVLLAAVAKVHPRPWLVFASSREVYGNGEGRPSAEVDDLRPRNVYGRTKAQAEALVKRAAENGTRATILRLGNVYGAAGDHADRVVPAFVSAAVNREALVVRGTNRTLDLIHVRDVNTAFVAAALAHGAGAPSGTLNICSGVEVQLGWLAGRIATLAASPSRTREEAPAPHEVSRFVGDNGRARDVLGWVPMVSLESGLVELVRLAQAARIRTLPAHGAQMKVLQVIHGYPMRYNAGSEVYTQTLAQALAERHEVHVFTREENPFAPDYALRHDTDPDDARVRLHVVNMPRHRDRYRHVGVDQRFAEVLDRVRPDVVHVGHLNHLSTSLLGEAAARGLPIVFTLHDYWLMCPRGQFMQMFPEDPANLWAACDGQDDEKCARRCYARYFSGDLAEEATDVAAWSDWVRRRMAHVREMVEHVDVFLAPARYLLDRFHRDFGLPAAKLRYLDYGFDRERLVGRSRASGEPFTFGYIGTHIPAKGIHQLIAAFGQVRGDVRLRIYGRPRGQDTEALKAIAAGLPRHAAERVEWLPEYRNQEIVRDVFDRVDAIVVPSVWVENSPLVIHEAQGAGVPVITADAGGMAEYVHHEVNGLLFRHRDPDDLARQMQRLADDPALARRLGARGYLYDPEGRIPDVAVHVRQVEAVYEEMLRRRRTARVDAQPGPWRITFDTNPDDCNLHCIMCEEHSVHSTLQEERKTSGKKPRRMPVELIRRVLEDSRGTGLREIIPSTMGEPLLYRHFEEIVELCREHGVLLNLTTNGTFPRLGARAWAERVVPVTSDVKISWNGASKATHEAIMVGTQWEKVLENVRTFIEVREAHAAGGGHRCRVTFQLTFLDTNVHELADVVRLAADLGVDRVKGHHLWAHFDAIKGLSMRRSPASIARWNAAVLDAREAVDRHRLPSGARVLLENIFLLDENATKDLAPGGQCPFLGQEAWVSAEGRFNPCCAPDAARRSLGEFGDLNEVGIREVWKGERYQRLIASYSSRALCLSCNMRKPVAP